MPLTHEDDVSDFAAEFSIDDLDLDSIGWVDLNELYWRIRNILGDSDAYPYNWDRIYSFAERLYSPVKNIVNLRDARCLEIGCGGFNPLGVSLLYYLNGASRAWAVDLAPIHQSERYGKTLYDFLGHILLEPQAYSLSNLALHELVSRIKLLPLADFKTGNLEQGLNKISNILLYQQKSITELDMEGGSFDFIYSMATLEHVMNLSEAITVMNHLLVPDGICVHNIGFQDHRAFENPQKYHNWSFMIDGQYGPNSTIREDLKINGLRASEIQTAFLAGGFEILAWQQIQADPVPEAVLASIHPHFSHMHPIDLQLQLANLIVRKRGNVSLQRSPIPPQPPTATTDQPSQAPATQESSAAENHSSSSATLSSPAQESQTSPRSAEKSPVTSLPIISQSKYLYVFHCTVPKAASQWVSAFVDHPWIYQYSGLRHVDFGTWFLEKTGTHFFDASANKKLETIIDNIDFEAEFGRNIIFSPAYIPAAYLQRNPFFDKNSSWAVFVIIRDPRDLIVSTYFSQKSSHPVVGDKKEQEVFRQIRQNLIDTPLNSGIKQVMHQEALRLFHLGMADWTKIGMQNNYIMVIKYEDLFGPAHEAVVESIMRHCDIAIPQHKLRELLGAVEFSKMSGGRRPGQEDADAHYRKGVAGDWKNYFDDDLKQSYVEIFGDLPEQLGYEPTL